MSADHSCIDVFLMFPFKSIFFTVIYSLQVDDASVIGENVVVSAKERKKGGLLIRSLTGDFFRVCETKPQVTALIHKAFDVAVFRVRHSLVSRLLWPLLVCLLS